MIGERERANLVVSTADFSLYNIISGAGRHHTVMLYAAPNFTHFRVPFVLCMYVIYTSFACYCRQRLAFETAGKQVQSPSKQTTEVSTLIQTVGFKLIQDSELQIPETLLEGGTVSSQVLSRQIVHNTVGSLQLAKNALHSTSIYCSRSSGLLSTLTSSLYLDHAGGVPHNSAGAEGVSRGFYPRTKVLRV